jgi:hypothetical protein
LGDSYKSINKLIKMNKIFDIPLINKNEIMADIEPFSGPGMG